MTFKSLAAGLCVGCFLFLILGDVARGRARRGLRDRWERLPFPLSTVVELEASTSTFYGRLKNGEADYFVSVDAFSGKTKRLGALPAIDGWIPGASALDSEQKRFFLVASQDSQNRILIVNIETGGIIGSSRLSHPIKTFEFDRSTGKLLGLARIDGVERFVSIDPSTGQVAVQADLNPVHQSYSGVFLDSRHDKMFFIGIRQGRDAAWMVDTASESIRELSGHSIGLNEHLIQSFKESGAAEAIFTSGAQSCTGIAGYDPRSQIGFIAHFAADFHKTELSLVQIDQDLREKYSLQGVSDLRLWVVGGVRESPASVRTLHAVYRILVDRLGVHFDEIMKFNTGISYNILIHNGEVRVF